jgi:hypothetical protein
MLSRASSPSNQVAGRNHIVESAGAARVTQCKRREVPVRSMRQAGSAPSDECSMRVAGLSGWIEGTRLRRTWRPGAGRRQRVSEQAAHAGGVRQRLGEGPPPTSARWR